MTINKNAFNHESNHKRLRYGPRIMMFAALALSVLVAGCDGSGGSSGDGELPGPNVQLSGRVTYDQVPLAADLAKGTAFLDYAGTVANPARGVQIAAIADDGSEVASGNADAEGRYVLTVPKNTHIRVRAVARLFQAPGDGASWNFSIRDNTSAGYAANAASIYAVQGEAFDTGVVHLSRDLHAASGWTGAGYGNTRSAAPFAILDQIYSAMQKVLAVDGRAVFAPMNTYWSVANRPTEGDKALGEIMTSHWQSATDQPGLYILGKEDVDTDEYDTGVIVHEWGHYFESKLSRSDSVGGSHSSRDVLDMRVAFGEAWGNSLSSMVRNDPVYADTNGVRQSQPGVVMDMDGIPLGEPRGWFNEASVQHVLYQMYKAPSIGFGPMYGVMVGPQKDTPAMTSLFSFATHLRAASDGWARGEIDTLLDKINTVKGDDLDIWGAKQTYPADLVAIQPGSKDFVIPVYQDLVPGMSMKVCGTDAFGTDQNKLGNYQFLRAQIAAVDAGDYELFLAPDVPLGADEWVFLVLYSRGAMVAELGVEAPAADDKIQVRLDSGDYVVAVLDKRLNTCQTILLSKK